jgi:hypothetical protein
VYFFSHFPFRFSIGFSPHFGTLTKLPGFADLKPAGPVRESIHETEKKNPGH